MFVIRKLVQYGSVERPHHVHRMRVLIVISVNRPPAHRTRIVLKLVDPQLQATFAEVVSARERADPDESLHVLHADRTITPFLEMQHSQFVEEGGRAVQEPHDHVNPAQERDQHHEHELGVGQRELLDNDHFIVRAGVVGTVEEPRAQRVVLREEGRGGELPFRRGDEGFGHEEEGEDVTVEEDERTCAYNRRNFMDHVVSSCHSQQDFPAVGALKMAYLALMCIPFSNLD
jgi:hypothetical protein